MYIVWRALFRIYMYNIYNPYQFVLQGLVVIFLFLQSSSTEVGNKKLETFFWGGWGGAGGLLYFIYIYSDMEILSDFSWLLVYRTLALNVQLYTDYFNLHVEGG